MFVGKLACSRQSLINTRLSLHEAVAPILSVALTEFVCVCV